jgi:lipoic acid synthetase
MCLERKKILINSFQRTYKIEIEKNKEPLGKRPDWLKVKLPAGENYKDVYQLMRGSKLHTVCEEA